MLSATSYELAMYVIDRLMEEDPPAESPSGEVLRTLSQAAKAYEDAMRKDEPHKID